MSRFDPALMSREEWLMSNPTVIDYNHRPQAAQAPPSWKTPIVNEQKDNFHDSVKLQLQMLNTNSQPSLEPLPVPRVTDSSKPSSSLGMWHPTTSTKDISPFRKTYNPPKEDNIVLINTSDDESPSKNATKQVIAAPIEIHKPVKFSPRREIKVTSGAAFYKGLILYIPQFEKLANICKSSPAIKMLHASFEFSFKMNVRIETKPRANVADMTDATVLYQGHIISTASGYAPHIEASVRALELLSETCYTIQAKEDYFLKCKLVNGDTMKALNLMKWEAVSQKYPKLKEVTMDSHNQKTFAVFLDNHMNSGEFEDIVCCNLTLQDVKNIKKVVEFFQLTMLPCSVSKNLSKIQSPCVVSIHKYSSAQKLLELLVESGGENEKFRLYPPDTFKDFYKLHPNFWDPALKQPECNKEDKLKTSLDDEELQDIILTPYRNIIPELFEKHKTILKVKEDLSMREAGYDFMKETLQIDMMHSKNVAPVERMQLLLKYMEQLQEYGSQVLISRQPEMFHVYHKAIDNLRKDLDTCRKDIEQDEKKKALPAKKPTKKTRSHLSRSPPPQRRTPHRRRTPPRRRSKSQVKRGRRGSSRTRSASPRRRPRSRSPKRMDKPLSPRRRSRSNSPRRRPLRSTFQASPPRKPRSPIRKGSSPPRRTRSPRPVYSVQPSVSEEACVFVCIFKDQFRRYVEILRRFRIEVEELPIENTSILKDKLIKYQEQLEKFHNDVMRYPLELGEYLSEVEICEAKIAKLADLIAEKSAQNYFRNITPPRSMNAWSLEHSPPFRPTHPLLDTRPKYSAGFSPPMDFNPPGFRFHY